VDRHHHLVCQAAKNVAQTQLLIGYSLAECSAARLSSRDKREKRARREKRYSRYLEATELHRQSISEWGIARALSINRVTVRTFVHADGLPERSQAKQRQHPGALRSLHPSALGRRMPQRFTTAVARYQKRRGIAGKAAVVRRYSRRLRPRLAQLTPEQRAPFFRAARAIFPGAKTTFEPPASRRGAWWLL